MKTIEQELAELRELFERATEATLALFERTMQIHALPRGEREELIEGERWTQRERARKAMIEYEAVLRGAPGMLQ